VDWDGEAGGIADWAPAYVNTDETAMVETNAARRPSITIDRNLFFS
jgi:hypothetical protein